MWAMCVTELGRPETLVLTDVPSPVPGSGQVRIKVHSAGCNFADTLMISGHYQYKPELPFIPGLEVAGTVLDTGEDVTEFAPGERVMAWTGQGGFAEEVVADAANTMRIPDGMAFREAGGFPITYSTALIALTHRRVHLEPGEVLLVNGAAGGAGQAAVDLGKALGATVVATVGSAAKVEVARRNGADHVINYATENIRDRVRETVGGVDVVFDPVGGEAFAQSLRSVNPDGRIAAIGFASGTVPQIPANYLLVKNISVIGVSVGGYRRSDPAITGRVLAELGQRYAAGELHPRVAHTFPLSETADALNMLTGRTATGKVVIAS
jgi:NADPH2:quinone reductase